MSDAQHLCLSDVLLPPISGSRPAGGVSSETEGIPSIGGENIALAGGMVYDGLKRVSVDFFRLMPKGRLLPNDVLINKDGAQTGKVGFYDGTFDEAAVNEHVFILRGRDPQRLDQRYLYYCILLPEIRNKIESRITGSAQPGLNSQFVKAVSIPIRTISKQRKIAAILTSIDTAIEQTEALIAKYQHIKAGLMHDLFTRGVLPNGQLRPLREQAPELYQETAIGWIPREWRASSCGQSCVIDSGITLGPHRRPNKRAHPYLRVANVYRDELRLEDVATLELLPGEEELVLKKFDLLVVEGHANRAEIGRCAMVCEDAEGMLFQNHLFRLRVTELNPVYALLWMNSHYIQGYWERACATSSGLNTINRKMLKAMPFFVPSDKEQERIAVAAETAKGRIIKTIADLDKLRRQKLGLMQDLLTGKVAVEVDSQNN